MNCSFDFLYHFVRDADSFIDFHTHASYEVVYYISGSGTTQIGKSVYEYAPGTFTIIPPHTKHNEYRHTESEVLFACFSYDNAMFNLINGLYIDHDRKLEQLLRAMQEELGSKRNYYHLTLHGLLCQAIAEIGRLIDTTDNTGATNDKVNYAKNFLEQYASESIDLQAIASSLGYSYDHFRHFFKKETGYSPNQFVIRKRVENAKTLLLHSEKSMIEIAHECGFSNAPQFSMLFSKHTGLSPRAFRMDSQFV